MPDVQTNQLGAILQELSDRITRIEQHLASTGLQVGPPVFGPGPASYGPGTDSFDAAPASFGPQSSFSGNAGPGYPPQGPGSAGIPPELVALARSGKMIQAIKQYRDLTGAGLREAKIAMEQAARGY